MIFQARSRTVAPLGVCSKCIRTPRPGQLSIICYLPACTQLLFARGTFPGVNPQSRYKQVVLNPVHPAKLASFRDIIASTRTTPVLSYNRPRSLFLDSAGYSYHITAFVLVLCLSFPGSCVQRRRVARLFLLCLLPTSGADRSSSLNKHEFVNPAGDDSSHTKADAPSMSCHLVMRLPQ